VLTIKATDLYNQLEKDFVTPAMTDNWFEYMSKLEGYLCDNFKQRSIGLMCDFTNEINKVYTAVFPSDEVLSKILDDGITDAMLFLHHALVWDLSKDPSVAFYQPNAELLDKLQERRVSLFCYHAPLDNFGEYSVSTTLANALGVTIEKPFAEDGGILCGVIGTTDCKNIHELNERYSQVVGHKTKLYQYGNSEITNDRIGICAGGGNDEGVVTDLIENGVNVLITGLSVNNTYSATTHELEKQHKINLLGGTHYSSEKFACIAICNYFKKLGLTAEFITDKPCMEDL